MAEIKSRIITLYRLISGNKIQINKVILRALQNMNLCHHKQRLKWWRLRKRKFWILCAQIQKQIQTIIEQFRETITDDRFQSWKTLILINGRNINRDNFQLQTKCKMRTHSLRKLICVIVHLTQWIWWKIRLWVTIILLCRYAGVKTMWLPVSN